MADKLSTICCVHGWFLAFIHTPPCEQLAANSSNSLTWFSTRSKLINNLSGLGRFCQTAPVVFEVFCIRLHLSVALQTFRVRQKSLILDIC